MILNGTHTHKLYYKLYKINDFLSFNPKLTRLILPAAAFMIMPDGY